MYKAILFIHVIIGIIALTSGAVALSVKKGRKLHIKSGNIYYLSMWGIAISAIVMTLMKFNPFLLSIAIFSLYLTYSGRKAINYWRLKQAYIPTLKDKAPTYVAFITALFMIGYPVALMLHDKAFFVPILSVFGTILFIFSLRDIKSFANPDNFKPHNKSWLLQHISKMCGAYIATVTAFLVNNIHFNPGWVIWLLPTAVGVPLIIITSVKWAKKLKIST